MTERLYFWNLLLEFLRFATKFKKVSIINDDSGNDIAIAKDSDRNRIDQREESIEDSVKFVSDPSSGNT